MLFRVFLAAGGWDAIPDPDDPFCRFSVLRHRRALAKANVMAWVVNCAIFYLHDWAGLPEVVKREWVPKAN